MSISWGVKERFQFNSAGQLTSWKPPAIPAVFAITYNQSASKPKSHTVLYFGQSRDLLSEAPDLNGRVIDAWKNAGEDENQLNVFIHAMPGSTSTERYRIQEQLIAEYRPKCNR